VRPTFRNWDLPIRRQLFCGLRLARDIEHHETRPGART
jgi:iron(II)-dependent oxidoreductase